MQGGGHKQPGELIKSKVNANPPLWCGRRAGGTELPQPSASGVYRRGTAGKAALGKEELFVGKLGTDCWSSREETSKQMAKIYKYSRSKTKGGFPGSKHAVCVQEPEDIGVLFANSWGKRTVKGEK